MATNNTRRISRGSSAVECCWCHVSVTQSKDCLDTECLRYILIYYLID